MSEGRQIDAIPNAGRPKGDAPPGGMAPAGRITAILDLLRCPATGSPLRLDGDRLVSTEDPRHGYAITPDGIPLFASELCSDDARVQQGHYDRVAQSYIENLHYPHTQEYAAYLDRALLDQLAGKSVGTLAEICCGRGEAIGMLAGRYDRAIGIDISTAMLQAAVRSHPAMEAHFVQGDATMLPIASGSMDNVFMLGGIHHVGNRRGLFAEIARILKPGGQFYFREPVSDFFLWRAIRAVIYRFSPALDHATERPLLHRETVPVLDSVDLPCRSWETYGFLGFCLFMNSDVLYFNRLFRFLPGIRAITRGAIALDELIRRIPGLSGSGLQVIGRAARPSSGRQ